MAYRAKMISKMVDELMGLNELKKKRKSYFPSKDPNKFRNSKTIACYNTELKIKEKRKLAKKTAKIKAEIIRVSEENKKMREEQAKKRLEEKELKIAEKRIKAEKRKAKNIIKDEPDIILPNNTKKIITKTGYTKYVHLCTECGLPAKYKYIKDKSVNKCEKCKWPNMVTKYEEYKIKKARA